MARLRPVPDTPPRAVAYLRQSVAREESISLELQETACRDYAARAGYQVIAVVSDPGISGRTWKRPGVQRVMAMVENRDVDVVLLWKWSRLSRSRRDWAIAADRVDVAGGRIESATEPVDVTTSTGRLTRGMLTELAAWESDVKSEQWKEAQARRLRNGLPHGGGSRFGYRYEAGAYLPDLETGPLLRSLYERYVAGEGFQQLVVALNRTGVPTMRGGRWTPTTLLRQLDSGFAAGLLQTGGVRHGTAHLLAGAHEPLIDEKLWRAYLARRDNLRRMPARLRHATYPLSGLVRCGACGSPMSAFGKRDRAGVMRAGYLYRCTGWQNGECDGVWATRSAVEDAVLEQVGAWVTEVDAAAATKTTRAAATLVAKVDRSRLLREQQRLARALAQLTVQVASGLVPEAAYRDARDELETQQSAVVVQLAATADDVAALRAPVAAARALIARWDTLPTGGRRDVLAQFVRRVEVHREGRSLRVVVVPIEGGV